MSSPLQFLLPGLLFPFLFTFLIPRPSCEDFPPIPSPCLQPETLSTLPAFLEQYLMEGVCLYLSPFHGFLHAVFIHVKFMFFYLVKKNVFIWISWVLIAAHGIFSCGMQEPVP